MAKKALGTIRLKLVSPKQVNTILSSLKPEVDSPLNRRTKTSLTADGNFLVLSVEAEDTVALRAALNAYLRWIGSTIKVMELLEKS
jgi:tRNA threonylcarbamoyladenosine modification (KEOPS) complex  Pcc1 subunit